MEQELDSISHLIDVHGERLSQELLAAMDEGAAEAVRKYYAEAGADLGEFFRDVYSSELLDDSAADIMLEIGNDGMPHVAEAPSDDEIAQCVADALEDASRPRP